MKLARARSRAVHPDAIMAMLAISAVFGAPSAAAQDTAAELAALRAEIARLAARVAELEARLTTADMAPPGDPGAPQDLTAAAAPHSSDEEAHEGATSFATALRDDDAAVARPAVAASVATQRPHISLGGRIKLDVVYNDRNRGSGEVGDTLLLPGSIELTGAGGTDQTSFSARASRLWVTGWHTTPYGDAGAYLEFDLLGSGGDARVTNGYGVRFRHGYGELGRFLFGQTFSTFVNVGALPEHNDDGLSAGGLLVRQPLVRYSHPLGAGALQFALEAPESTITLPDGRRLAPDDDRLPDMVVRYQRNGAFGQWSLAAMVRELRIDERSMGARDAAVGAAANLAGDVRLGLADSVRFTASGGNALGRYMAFNAFDGARLDAEGVLHLTPMAGGTVTWQHLWSRSWRSNFTAAYAWADTADAPASVNASLYTTHANLLWTPVASTTLGIEWIHAWRERADGRSGRLNRLQFSAVHKF